MITEDELLSHLDDIVTHTIVSKNDKYLQDDLRAIASAAAAIRELRQDAARLDWLERYAGVCVWDRTGLEPQQIWLTGPTPLRGAIDAWMGSNEQ